MKSPLLIFLFSMLLAVSDLAGQSGDGSVAPSPTVPVTVTSLPVDTQFVRGQLDTLRTFHDSLINTVYWALGAVFAIAALLVGYNWAVLGKGIERDKEAFRETITTTIRSEIEKGQERLDNYVESNLKSIRDQLEDEMKTMQCELIKHEARYWRQEGSPNNEFTQYKDLLELAATADKPHYITQALAGLQRVLETNVQLFSSDIAALTSELDRLPSEYNSHLASLKPLLAAKVKTSRPA